MFFKILYVHCNFLKLYFYIDKFIVFNSIKIPFSKRLKDQITSDVLVVCIENYKIFLQCIPVDD